MAHLDRKELAKLVRLKQTESVWLCSVRLTSMRIGATDEEAIQPYIVLVIDATEGMARSFELSVDARPDAAYVAEVLAKAMYAPMSDAPPEFSSVHEDLVPVRPQRVLIDEVALVESLKPAFMLDFMDMDLGKEMQDNPEALNQLKQIFGNLLGNDQPKLPPADNGTWKKRK